MAKKIYYVKQIVKNKKRYIEIAEDYASNPEKYVRTFSVVINGKLRHLITYQNNHDGMSLRILHLALVGHIKRRYSPAENSYAYMRNRNILGCVSKHLQAEAFLKTDIHAYFDSISYDRMLSRVLQLRMGATTKKDMSLMMKACFYEGKLPIGFVSSPVLSDLFLVDLDRKLGEIENVTYTRYADDFIISVDDLQLEPLLIETKDKLISELNSLGLELNTKKTYIRRLKMPGDAIHVLGVNLVKDSPTNRITVSDKYIRETCKMISEYIGASKAEKEADIFKVSGRIEFVRYCSSSSFEKLRKMTKVKCGIDSDLTVKELKLM